MLLLKHLIVLKSHTWIYNTSATYPHSHMNHSFTSVPTRVIKSQACQCQSLACRQIRQVVLCMHVYNPHNPYCTITSTYVWPKHRQAPHSSQLYPHAPPHGPCPIHIHTLTPPAEFPTSTCGPSSSQRPGKEWRVLSLVWLWWAGDEM